MGKLTPMVNRAFKGRAPRQRQTKPANGTEVSNVGRRMRVGFMSAAHAKLLNPRMAQFAGLTAS